MLAGGPGTEGVPFGHFQCRLRAAGNSSPTRKYRSLAKPGNANLPIGGVHHANREIDVPGRHRAEFRRPAPRGVADE